MFYYINLFYFKPPKYVGGMEGEEQKNLTETLNSLVGARGMEEDKYYYFVLFQSSKICRRNGREGQKNLTETLNSLERARGMEE